MTTFTVTTSTDRVKLDGSRRGRASFNATNISSRQIRGRAQVFSLGDSRPEWFSLEGDSQRPFPAGTSQQFDVLVELPEAAAGQHQFRLDVIGVEVPDEDFGQSEPVIVALAGAPAPPPKSKGYLTTFAGAMLGGLAGALVGTLPGSIVFISLSHQTFANNPGASIGEVLAQAFVDTIVVALIGAALLLLGVFVGLWIGPVLGAYVALRSRVHLYVGWTVGLLAVIQPIVVVLLVLLAGLLFKSVKQAGPELAILIVLAVLAVAIPPWLARGAARLIKVHGL
jgi:hypothetical protein